MALFFCQRSLPTGNSVTVTSFGLENYWKDEPPRRGRYPEITKDNTDFSTIEEMLEFYQNDPKAISYGKQEVATVMRHYTERHPEYMDHAWIVLNCLDMDDPYHDKALRGHTGYHPQTMLNFAKKVTTRELDHIAHHLLDWYRVQGSAGDLVHNHTGATRRDVLIMCICKKGIGVWPQGVC